MQSQACELSKVKTLTEKKVVIREADCIGCTKCLPVCPTDAIVGASKQRHVIVSSLCIGCGLCIAPCPTDCIDWVELTERSSLDRQHQSQLAKHQILRRKARLKQIAADKMHKDKQATAHMQMKITELLNKISS